MSKFASNQFGTNSIIVVKASLKKVKSKGREYAYARIPQLPKELANKELVIIPREEFERLAQTFDANSLTQKGLAQTVDIKLILELSKAIVAYEKAKVEKRKLLRKIALNKTSRN